jgi:hypothetical protein
MVVVGARVLSKKGDKYLVVVLDPILLFPHNKIEVCPLLHCAEPCFIDKIDVSSPEGRVAHLLESLPIIMALFVGVVGTVSGCVDDNKL